MDLQLSPIVVFAFNRPFHLEKTLSSLSKNHGARESNLFIYCDGPRSEQDIDLIQKTIEVAKTKRNFAGIEVFESPTNKGLARSIMDGVTEVCSRFEQIIVLEDDMITSPFFLEFMNDGLQKFRDDERVVSIHGYTYPVKIPPEKPFFLKGADCWGWATWQRGWSLFNENSELLIRQLEQRKCVSEFNFNNSHNYFQMLKDQRDGKNNSWAIRWYASAFLANKLTLYPPRSLVNNIGFDSSGTHCGTYDGYESTLMNFVPDISKIEVEESLIARESFEQFFRNQNTLVNRFKTILKNLFK